MNRELFYRYLAQTSSAPLALEIERAEGLYMYGTDGKQYMDLISGIAVSVLGHRHPAVLDAVRKQLDQYMHLMVYGEFVQAPQVQLAALLVKHLPVALDNVYLVNSGSEAIEGALKLAKRYTGRTEIIAFDNAYHGSSHGALSVTGHEGMKKAFRPLLPQVHHIPYGQIDMLDKVTAQTACVVAEPIQGEAGAIVPDKDFMIALRQRCSDTGALLILDEIQAGMGRTGKLWAFEHYGIEPDILTLAKALGGGLPIGAFIAGKEIMHCLTEKPVLGHITTFGGNALCAAAARATLKTIVDGKLWEYAAVLEKVFRDTLKHPRILGIRGRGLLLGLEFANAYQCREVIARCINKGLVTDWFLFADHCLRIAPPLIITRDQAKAACDMILESVEEIKS